jgi:hypothetical protein
MMPTRESSASGVAAMIDDSEVFPDQLRAAARSLREGVSRNVGDAKGAKEIQRLARRALGHGAGPFLADAYFLDVTIEDVFYNIFGDIHYDSTTEKLRIGVCAALAELFDSLAEAAGDAGFHGDAWKQFACTYARLVADANSGGLD